jgi:hypothetical protein
MDFDGSEEMERLLRTLTARSSQSDRDLDLFSKKLNLMCIKSARHSFRAIMRAARRCDEETGASDQVTCEEDAMRFVVLICARILGGEERPLSEDDRHWIGQVLGLEVSAEVFAYATTKLHEVAAADLDKLFPVLITKQATQQDLRVFNSVEQTLNISNASVRTLRSCLVTPGVSGRIWFAVGACNSTPSLTM